MPVAFLAPLALAALGLVAGPVVVHMLRRSRSKRLDFPDLRFLRETPSLVRRFTPPNRRWLLALRVFVVAAIALAAARPVWTDWTGSGSAATVVLVDGSASMSRPEARDAALSAAREVLGRLDASDRVSVAQFDRSIRWLARDASRDEAIAALAGYAPGLAAADVSVALEDAQRSLAAVPGADRKVVIVSDFQVANGPWSRPAGYTASIQPVRIENAFDNAFVVDASIEGTKDGEALGCSIVRATGEGRSVWRASVPLADGAATEGLLVAVDGATWQARVTAPDGFGGDDVRFGIAGSTGQVLVCDPGAGAPYLSAAARVNAGDAAVRAVPQVDRDSLAGASIAIVSSRALAASGALAAIDEWVRAGGSALIFAAGAVAPTDLIPGVTPPGETGATVSLAALPSSPAAIALRSDSIRAGSVEAKPSDAVIARDSDGDAVVVRRNVDAGVVTVAGFDASPASGRLVLDGGFPDVVQELVGPPPTASMDVGDTLPGLPPGATVGIEGRRLPTRPDGSVVLDSVGLARVSSPSGSRIVAVNVPTAESEPAQLTAGEVAALACDAAVADAAPAAALAASESRWPLWRFLLALALAAAVVELAVLGLRRRPLPSLPPARADEETSPS
ncbi:MAG: BatA domain-containing protein [Acidobacteria bacterium]|nr:BatA domain-containing protein [Acidobacteriota bacterium]